MLVFMLEEVSMKALLEGLLPRVLPEDVEWVLIPHEGRTDLEKTVTRKLRAFRRPKSRFMVVRDQDNEDCAEVKSRLAQYCKEAGRPDSVIRVVCRELESWLLGDLEALGRAFGRSDLGRLQNKSKFREPDKLGNASQEVRKLVPGYQKVMGARAVGPLLSVDAETNRSVSFHAFIRAVAAMSTATK